MSPETVPPDTQGASSHAVKQRRLGALVLRIGILGVLVVALAISAASFALFGCTCAQSQTSNASRNIEGMTVNPPDPPMHRPAKK